MITIAINKNSTDQLQRIANYIDALPNRIAQANSQTAMQAKRSIPRKLAKMGRGGKYVEIEISRYGPVGVKMVLKPQGSLNRTGKGRTKRNTAWGGAIFLKGRRAYVIPPRIVGGKEKGYKLRRESHAEYGKFRNGPLYISAIKPKTSEIKAILREDLLNKLSRNYMSVGFGPQGGGSRLSDF
jgi:hypothetical protein